MPAFLRTRDVMSMPLHTSATHHCGFSLSGLAATRQLIWIDHPWPYRMIRPTTNTFKILLMLAALGLVAAMLLYSRKIIEQLLDKEREVVDLYAKSLENVSKSVSG